MFVIFRPCLYESEKENRKYQQNRRIVHHGDRHIDHGFSGSWDTETGDRHGSKTPLTITPRSSSSSSSYLFIHDGVNFSDVSCCTVLIFG